MPLKGLQVFAEVDGGEDSQSRGQWLEPWLTCCGPHLRQIASDITKQYLNANKKTRQPKADLRDRLSVIVSTIVANLFRALSQPEPQRLAVRMMNKAPTRYDRQDFRQLPNVIRWLAEEGLAEKLGGKRNQSVTTIAASGPLLIALRNPAITLAEIERAEGGESIILTARTGRDAKGQKLPAEFIDYEETRESIALREELAEVSTFLKTQSIELNGIPRRDFMLMRRFLLRNTGALPTFDLHGRIYGGFWVTLPKRERAMLRINGEPIADLDFSSIFPRLAYAHVGIEPPDGDLYVVPGLEEHRSGVKAGLSALFSSQSEMVRLPAPVKDQLPAGWTASRFKTAIAAKHLPIAPLFGRDIAMDFMATESQIMMTALQDLMRQGIPALPIHDGMMVGASNAQRAKAAMEAASLKVTGSLIPVTQTDLPI